MKKNLQTSIYIILLQTILSYLISVLIVNDSISMSVLFKSDFFLFVLIWIFFFFISCHILFPIKKVYQFLFEKRYFIAVFLLIILVLGKFNGSSYGLWNYWVEPNHSAKTLTPLIGTSRSIRSDEWLVNSSYVLSQSKTGYQYFNPVMRATKTDVFATIPVPIASVVCLAKPFTIGYLLLGNDYGMSFYWFGRLIALFMVTFELLMLLTKKKKIPSLIGTILITFSPPVFWWYSAQLVEILIGGGFTILMFNQFLKTDSVKKKIIFSLLMIWGFLSYVFTLYPAWLIPFSYIYLILAVYLVLDSKDYHKYKVKNFLPLLLPVFIFAITMIYFFSQSSGTFHRLMSTVYPGARFVTGGSHFENLFSYPASLFFPYYNVGNPSELSTFYSCFPVVFFLSCFFIIMNRKQWKKHLLFLSLMLLMVIYCIFAFISFPDILAKVTLLSMVPVERLTVVISFLSIILLTLLLGNIKFNNKNSKLIIIFLVIILTILTIFLTISSLPTDYLSLKKIIVMTIMLLLMSLCIVYSFKIKAQYLLLGIVSIISLISTIYINPLMKGFSGLEEKPLSQELKKKEYKNQRFLALNSFIVPNYLGSQGIKVINSTNIYPNLKLWKKIDSKKKYEEIYNRYAHIEVTLSNKSTVFKLVQGDYFKISLNADDLCRLDVDYVTSLEKLEQYEKPMVTFQQKYHKDNIYLYKVNCLGG